MKEVFRHQLWHLLSTLLLLFATCAWVSLQTETRTGSLWGINSTHWMLLALVVPVAHQVYVLICWRIELHHKGITNVFGDKGFMIYKIGFALLIILRPISIFLLGWSNRNTLELPAPVCYGVALVLLLPSAYLLYSVKKYFGMDRAFGKDHFYPEEFRNKPLVQEGIFK